MKAFIFIPDTRPEAGSGHISRCIKFSKFINNNKFFFLIKNNTKNNFIKKINNNQIIYFNNLKIILDRLKNHYQNLIFIIDTYQDKIISYNFKKYSSTQILILDYNIKNNFSNILDHTFKRKKNFYRFIKKKKINFGLSYFPIAKKINYKKKKIILIDYGSIKNNVLINASINFIKKFSVLHKYKIIIINKYFKKKMINQNIKLNIKIFNHVDNINNIYSKTYFSFGSCGISLYEKSFYHIPSIIIKAAYNQKYNFLNYIKNNCALNFEKICNNYYKNSNIFFRDLKFIKKNLKKNFLINTNIKNLKKYFKQF